MILGRYINSHLRLPYGNPGVPTGSGGASALMLTQENLSVTFTLGLGKTNVNSNVFAVHSIQRKVPYKRRDQLRYTVSEAPYLHANVSEAKPRNVFEFLFPRLVV